MVQLKPFIINQIIELCYTVINKKKLNQLTKFLIRFLLVQVLKITSCALISNNNKITFHHVIKFSFRILSKLKIRNEVTNEFLIIFNNHKQRINNFVDQVIGQVTYVTLFPKQGLSETQPIISFAPWLVIKITKGLVGNEVFITSALFHFSLVIYHH